MSLFSGSKQKKRAYHVGIPLLKPESAPPEFKQIRRIFLVELDSIKTGQSPGAANESPLMNPIMTHPCDPTLAHSWKGSFDIKGATEFAPGMLNNCIQAYPPSKVRRKSPGAANESPLMNPIMTHPCDPTLAHSWKGSFDIKGATEFAPGMLNNCIQAYPPSKVKRKVYEFSRLLSGTLKFELVPREAIWTSQFNNHFPGKEDTGLYFLVSERERRYLLLWWSLANKDSVMRMLINDVELLLITKS
ncbi:hypothetical protein BC332_09090 [Capsicum chinense]|nr:hypothetical protein BC332_09090 [Capsicum chinense]